MKSLITEEVVGHSGQPLAITLLYAPADRPDRVIKALASGADVVVIDLEDAIAPSAKDRARNNLRVIAEVFDDSTRVQVRVNAMGTRWHEEDIERLAELPPSIAIRLPKVVGVNDVEHVTRALPGRDVHALIETPLGLECALSIAQAGVTSLGLGEADLRSHLGLPAGVDGDVGLTWARARIVNAAAAAHILPPMMSVYTKLDDEQGLLQSTAAGRAYGFVGRAAIHPKQLDPIRDAMRPTARDVEQAQMVIEGITKAEDAGAGVLVLADGSFIDSAMVVAARRTLEIEALTK